MLKSSKTKPPSRERTSADIAHVAGQLLNGTRTRTAIDWLQEVADNPVTTQEARSNAVVLLGVVESMKRVAASALTQR